MTMIKTEPRSPTSCELCRPSLSPIFVEIRPSDFVSTKKIDKVTGDLQARTPALWTQCCRTVFTVGLLHSEFDWCARRPSPAPRVQAALSQSCQFAPGRFAL